MSPLKICAAAVVASTLLLSGPAAFAQSAGTSATGTSNGKTGGPNGSGAPGDASGGSMSKGGSMEKSGGMMRGGGSMSGGSGSTPKPSDPTPNK